MRFQDTFARACAALVLLAALGAAPSAAASTPALIWRDVARLNVLCLVQTEAGVDQGPLRDRLCNSVVALAAAGSPVPVQQISAGDPAVLRPDAVTLLVHASVQDDTPRRLLVLNIRPFRNSAEPLLFAAAPRAVPLADGPAPDLEAALAAALSETLPWLSRPAGPRPVR